jgi:hypothetical protein
MDHDLIISESSDKILLLRILKCEREELATRMMAVEMLEQRQFNSTLQGEAKHIGIEISFLSRMIIHITTNLEEAEHAEANRPE